jgi:hypothetical protein
MLWTLALCPVVILPPFLALFMSFRSPAVPNEQSTSGCGPELTVIIAAVCNIILSVMFWRWIGETAMATGISIGLFLKSFGFTHSGGIGSI